MNVKIAPLQSDKKVCIVVPVYNAEKFLGHALNSLVSQTYTNWTAILVDDGSTDGSLEICRQYAAVDSRFRVLSKENGGVSSARNAGLAEAEGDYLAFLDSDDYLAQDALEKMVNAARIYNSQLVIMDIRMVDFTKPELGGTLLSSEWLKESPCCLDADAFREKRMRLVWFTVLMECLHGKLYDMALWKEQKITFPEELSLGEDFVANMRYFEATNRVVFIHECGHYYNCIQNSGSLAQKYRPDLFENKMLLMEALEAHLGGRESLSKPERDAFYCYAASNGLSAVERFILDSGLQEQEMHEGLQKKFAHPLFAEALNKASYIPDRFMGCMEAVKQQDLEYVVQYIADGPHEKAAEKDCVEALIPEEPKHKLGLLNRVIRKLMRIVIPLFGQSKMAERLTRWEYEFYLHGLKKTIRSHAHAHSLVTNAVLEEQVEQVENQIGYVAGRVENQIWHVENQIEHIGNHIANEIAQRVRLENQLTDLDNRVNDAFRQLNDRSYSVEEKIRISAAHTQEMVEGYVWRSEERLRKENYRREINELRQRKKAIMIATAEHANIGDAAITLAEQIILSEQFPEYFQVEISTYEFEQKEAYLHAILNHEDILFIHGGGNLGDLYPVEEELHRKIVSEFPENKIVILPQTISFSATETGVRERDKSARVYNAHKDLTLFVRGENSLEFARTYFNQVNTILMPDSAHVLRSNYVFERNGALLCLRADMEGKLGGREQEFIASVVQKHAACVNSRTNVHSEDVSREIRGLVVRRELMHFASHQVVVTDRLHGMIFAAITSTPCVVLSSRNHKIQEYYEAFFRDSNAVFFIGDDLAQLDDAVKQAVSVQNAQYSVFEKSPHSSLCALTTDR